MLYALWAFSGWCGTPYPGRGPHPGPPDPNPWLIKLIAIIGGVLGGWAVSKLATTTTVPDGATAFVATMVGAFVVGRVFSDIATIAMGDRATAPN